MIDEATTAKLDAARRNGASAGDILAALQKAHPDPEAAFKAYANSKLPDGRRRSQVNMGDPAEWGDG
jgi:serine/threonine protein kinase HipA of HipAB toxin-antitoxin module